MASHSERYRQMGIDLILMSLKDIKKIHSQRGHAQEMAQEALEWFNERSTKVCGYGWALQQCNGNPNVIRRTINSIINKSV